MRTIEEIDLLLAVNAEAILRVTSGKVASYTIGGRQVAFEGANKLTELRAQRNELERDRARLLHGGGIIVRYGVPR
jgi:hypothetical protein